MSSTPEHTFVDLINANIGIAYKISKVYFNDSDDRDDAFQEMMYQLWRSFPSFGGRSKFSTWMYQVCLNTVITYRRKTKSRNEELDEKHFEIAADDSNNEEDIAELLKAISTLSPVNKAIILLYLDGISYEEIATITGLTKANVGVKLVRIKKELETKLKSN